MTSLESKFAQMNSAISDFVDEMKSQDLWENVVLVTSSDFGRTITPNSAGGTDHGLLLGLGPCLSSNWYSACQHERDTLCYFCIALFCVVFISCGQRLSW